MDISVMENLDGLDGNLRGNGVGMAGKQIIHRKEKLQSSDASFASEG